jgi:hypothetical protein
VPTTCFSGAHDSILRRGDHPFLPCRYRPWSPPRLRHTFSSSTAAHTAWQFLTRLISLGVRSQASSRITIRTSLPAIRVLGDVAPTLAPGAPFHRPKKLLPLSGFAHGNRASTRANSAEVESCFQPCDGCFTTTAPVRNSRRQEALERALQ